MLRLVAALLLFGIGARANAATFTVNSTADTVDANPGNAFCADVSGNCTLRAAIMEANALAGADVVAFSIGGTISRSSPLTAIAQALTINGPGPSALTINAAGLGSVLIVSAGVTATISGLTLTGGIGSGSGGTAGGGIVNEGTLTLTNMRIVANSAQFGGGIYNSPGADVVLVDSTVDGNMAAGGFGGAIYNVGSGTIVTITRSTISRNTSFSAAINAPFGTSIAMGNSTVSGNIGTGTGSISGIQGSPTVTVTSSTIYGNTGIGMFGGKLRNSIVDSCGSGGGIVQSLGGNLAPASTCFQSPGAGDVFSPNFLLGPLQNNGGPTETHALLPGSPAIDAVPLASCTVSIDERGVARPQGIACDIGAYELQPIPTPTLTPTVTSTSTHTPTSTVTRTPSPTPPACVPPPAGIVAWWPLDASMPATLVDDIWAFNNDGAVVGPPGWGAGWVNGAFQFNGSSTYLDVPSAPSLNFGSAGASPPGDFSIDAWIMLPSTAATSSVRSIVDKRQSGGSLGYQFYLFNRQMGLQLADTTFTNFNSTFAIPADGQWHHIAVTVERNQNTGVRFYYDGSPAGVTGNAQLRQGTLANSSPLRIGAQLFGGQFLDGSLDELQVFNRALAAAEVQAIFNAQQAGKCTPTPSPTSTATATPTASQTSTPSGHAEVCVLKFHDANGNGMQDTGEAGLPGWNVEITNLAGNVVASITTGATGIRCTGVPAPATYTVTEILQAGWTQTFPPPPGVHTVTLSNGQLLNLAFGNRRTSDTPTPTPIPTATTAATATVTRSPTPTPTAVTTTPTPSSATPTATPPCANPPADMVGWWTLDESPGAVAVADLAGLANDGGPRDAGGGIAVISASPSAPPAGPALVTSPPLSLPSGMVDGALYFYGPYVEVPNQSELNFGTGDLTIDAWVWPPAPVGSGGAISSIVDKLDLTQHSGYAFYLTSGPGGPYNVLSFRFGSGTAFSTTFSAVSLTYGMWNHVAVTVHRNVANGVTLYIDGIMSGIGPQTAGNSDNALSLWIGKSRLSPPAGFAEFAIDEVEIFNRALSQAEIQTISDAGSAGKCKPPRCAGDCDGNARVSVDELVRGVNIALASVELRACSALDLNRDGVVTIDELTNAIERSLDGCEGEAADWTD